MFVPQMLWVIQGASQDRYRSKQEKISIGKLKTKMIKNIRDVIFTGVVAVCALNLW